MGDGRTGPDGRVRSDRHWCHKLCVRTDEGAILDDGTVLVHAIIIACDRTGTDVDILSYRAVSDITQMVDFAAGIDIAILDFDEIADVRMISDVGTGTDSGKWADTAFLAYG